MKILVTPTIVVVDFLCYGKSVNMNGHFRNADVLATKLALPLFLRNHGALPCKPFYFLPAAFRHLELRRRTCLFNRASLVATPTQKINAPLEERTDYGARGRFNCARPKVTIRASLGGAQILT